MDFERWLVLKNDPDDEESGGEGNPHGDGSGDGYPPIGDDDD